MKPNSEETHMASSNDWRGNRDENRYSPGRNERDWRGNRPAADIEGEGFRRRWGWREGSDYYGDRPERYGAGNYDAYGQGSSESWRHTDEPGYRNERPSGGNRPSFNDRWQNSYGSSGASNFRGYGGYGGGDYGERGTYGGYGRAQFGSSTEHSSDPAQVQEHFKGRGPKGYRRSDERIREDVCECLTDDDRVDASRIDVSVKDGEVTLSGSVGSRAEKRRAEDLMDHISGVKDVQNQLRVAGESEGSLGSATSSDDRDPSRQDIHH
jgi:hypothetical protein